jgi:hypothetical protein
LSFEAEADSTDDVGYAPVDEAETETEVESCSSGFSDTGVEADAETWSETETDAEAYSETDAEVEAETCSETDADADT